MYFNVQYLYTVLMYIFQFESDHISSYEGYEEGAWSNSGWNTIDGWCQPSPNRFTYFRR